MKMVDIELYDLAIALADSAARSDIECVCPRTGDNVGTYKLQAVGKDDIATLVRA